MNKLLPCDNTSHPACGLLCICMTCTKIKCAYVKVRKAKNCHEFARGYDDPYLGCSTKKECSFNTYTPQVSNGQQSFFEYKK